MDAFALALGSVSYPHRSRAPSGCRQCISAEQSQSPVEEETSATSDAYAQKGSWQVDHIFDHHGCTQAGCTGNVRPWLSVNGTCIELTVGHGGLERTHLSVAPTAARAGRARDGPTLMTYSTASASSTTPSINNDVFNNFFVINNSFIYQRPKLPRVIAESVLSIGDQRQRFQRTRMVMVCTSSSMDEKLTNLISPIFAQLHVCLLVLCGSDHEMVRIDKQTEMTHGYK